jgi:hypothetical protein
MHSLQVSGLRVSMQNSSASLTVIRSSLLETGVLVQAKRHYFGGQYWPSHSNETPPSA